MRVRGHFGEEWKERGDLKTQTVGNHRQGRNFCESVNVFTDAIEKVGEKFYCTLEGIFISFGQFFKFQHCDSFQMGSNAKFC